MKSGSVLELEPVVDDPPRSSEAFAPRQYSTDMVPPQQRLAYYADALTTGLQQRRQVQVESAFASFRAQMEIVDLNGVKLVAQTGSAHRAFRRSDGAFKPVPRSYSVMVNLRSAWHVVHRQGMRLEPGDAIVIDSDLDAEMRFPSDFAVSQLWLSETWLRQWLPSPGALIGRRIAANSGWGRALASFVGQLSPGMARSPAFPLSMLVDHAGALLALTAAGLDKPHARRSPAVVDLTTRIESVVLERCTEPELKVTEVAASLGVSTRTVHRTLARGQRSFAELLVNARTDAAMALLKLPASRRLTTAEIGRRAGFSDATHFARAVRARCGLTPARMLLQGGDQFPNPV